MPTSNRFIIFVNHRGGSRQTREGPEKAPVRLVLPSNKTRAAPAVLAERIEAPVVANAVGRVRLDVVSAQVTQAGPSVEETRPARHNIGNRSSALLAREAKCFVKGGEGRGLEGRKNCFRRTAGGEIYWCV